MTPLDEARADLAAWLPHARALISQPDTQPGTGRDKPGSKPPWNQAAADACYDAHALVRELEQNLRYAITGRIRHRGGSDLNTLRALDSIGKLAAADQAAADDAARQLSRCVTVIMQLPAVDLEERTRQVAAACPRCGRLMLRIYERSGRVGCLGCGRRGQMMPGTVSDGYVEWEDGELT